VDECNPLSTGNRTAAAEMEQMKAAAALANETGRGSHSFKFELNLSNSRTYP